MRQPLREVVDHDPDGVVVDAEFEASIDAPAAAPASWSCTCGVNNAAARATCCACDLPRDGAPPIEQAPAQAPANASPGPARASRTGWTIPGGREKGVDVADATDRTLEWWANTIEEKLANGTADARFAAKDRELAHVMRQELARRQGGGGAADGFDGVPPDDDIPFATSAMHSSVHPRVHSWEQGR